MRFSVYFDCILNEKWLFSYKNNDISCTHYRGHATLQEVFENMCNLKKKGFLKGSLCIEQCSLRRVTCRYNYRICCISPMNTHEV